MSWGRYHLNNILIKSAIFVRKHIYIFKKATKITPIFLNKWVYIYNGKRFFRRYIYAKYVGYRFGELVWTRKPAIFKKKKKKRRLRSKKTRRKQTKTLLKRRKKLLFRLRRKRIKKLKKEKLIELNPLLRPRKASQKFLPDTVSKILKIF